MSLLPATFYSRKATEVAADLIGCKFLFDGIGGIIVETEAYRQDDPACHAYRGKTERNRVLFGPPARSYVYFSYGMHNLLNFVAEADGRPAAVLIRAVEPTDGVEAMQSRRRSDKLNNLCSGPGKLTQALAVDLNHNDRPLNGGRFQIFARSGEWQDPQVVAGPRVGISEATDWPWRFCAAGSEFISR